MVNLYNMIAMQTVTGICEEILVFKDLLISELGI
jgi:hypothetical protein